MLDQCVNNNLVFNHIMADSRYGGSENMELIKGKFEKNVIFPLKSKFHAAITFLGLEAGKVNASILKGYNKPVYVAHYQVKNNNTKPSVLYLVTSDEKLDWNSMLTCYQKRWQVELFHKSVKQNVAIEKAPLISLKAIMSHCYASVQGFIKLELLRIKYSICHNSNKELIRYNSNQDSFATLQNLSMDTRRCLCAILKIL